MRKLKQKNGVTLMETVVALLVVVFLVLGMDSGMNAGMRAYSDSIFQSDCATLTGILNTSIGDILRYAEDVRTPKAGAMYVDQNGTGFVDSNGSLVEGLSFVFTNRDYYVQDAYFFVPKDTDNERYGVLQLKTLRKDTVSDLVNTGAYPDLKVTDFAILYIEPDAETEGGYFKVDYTVSSKSDSNKTKDVTFYVRLMNT